ncbi:hypothetical protein DM02DRAFT_613351 [Periconia macrospinosa]|uniref:Uncharacterized protein n=1 Tax=Periconia macrospinosa TaxID=97972 RepID=A0A2V1DYI7_9PLEO|nr:hypothetical protein DM02DRAFT_613351 [Periconia macrospinosa]
MPPSPLSLLSPNCLLWLGAYYSCRTLQSEMHAYFQPGAPKALTGGRLIFYEDPFTLSMYFRYPNDDWFTWVEFDNITPSLNAFGLISKLTAPLQVPLSDFKKTWLDYTFVRDMVNTLLGLYINHVHFTLHWDEHWVRPFEAFEGDMADGLVIPFILAQTVHCNVVTVALERPEDIWAKSKTLSPVEKVVGWGSKDVPVGEQYLEPHGNGRVGGYKKVPRSEPLEQRDLRVEYTVTKTVDKKGRSIQRRYDSKRRRFMAVKVDSVGRRMRRSVREVVSALGSFR